MDREWQMSDMRMEASGMNTHDWRSVAAQNYDLQETDESLRLFFHPISRFYHQNLEQLAQWADYLSVEKGLPVCRMMRNHDGRYDTEVNGESWVLMIPPELNERLEFSAGAMLAELHAQTTGVDPRAFPETPERSRAGDFESRLDVLEKKYDISRTERQHSAFEQEFLDNFPYFLGCGENAIQMTVDESINFPNEEPLCISHYRFANYDRAAVENPAEWVVDDRSRDLAEGLRVLAWRCAGSDPQPAAEQFLDDYESRFPLSEQVIGKLYSRLLYPLAFVECCERYFFDSNASDQRELEFILRKGEESAEDNERLLTYMANRYNGRFYAPEWLTRIS
jgi:spore coat protein YutH